VKLDRITFNTVVFDPASAIGADNVKSFFTVKNGYDIDLDEASGLVTVTKNGRKLLMYVSSAKEMRPLLEGTVVVETAAPKFIAVKQAEGSFAIVPVPVVELEDKDEGAEVIPPRKRGRPRKVA
jgi:hypothetical protein